MNENEHHTWYYYTFGIDIYKQQILYYAIYLTKMLIVKLVMTVK